jgi:hypothetical protein
VTIIEAARELFIAQGYGATNLQDIADRVGVAVQSTYYGVTPCGPDTEPSPTPRVGAAPAHPSTTKPHPPEVDIRPQLCVVSWVLERRENLRSTGDDETTREATPARRITSKTATPARLRRREDNTL